MANPSVASVADTAAYASGTSHTIAMTGVTAGNVLVLFIGAGQAAGTAVTGVSGGGATWTLKAHTTDATASSDGYVYEGTGTTGGSFTITITTLSVFVGATAYEIANANSTFEVCVIADTTTATTTFAAPSETPTTTGDLIIEAVFATGPLSSSPSSPWVTRNGPLAGSSPLIPSAYQTGLTGGTAYQATWHPTTSARYLGYSVVLNNTPTVVPVAHGTVNAITSSSAAATYTGITTAAGDKILWFICTDSTAAPSFPGGWTVEQTVVTGGGVSVTMASKDAAGGESGTVTATGLTGATTGDTWLSQYRSSLGAVSVVSGATTSGTCNPGTTAYSITGSSETSLTADRLVCAFASLAPTGAYTGANFPSSLTQAGASVGTIANLVGQRSNSNTFVIGQSDCAIAAGGTGAPNLADTTVGENAAGAGIFLFLRAGTSSTTWTGTEALAVATTLALTPQATYQPTMGLAVGVSVALTPSVEHDATIALGVGVSLALTPSVEHDATETLAVQTAVALTPQVTYQPTDALAVQSALALTPQATYQPTEALAVATTVGVIPNSTFNATDALAIAITLALTPSVEHDATIALAVAAVLALTPLAEHDATVALAIATTLSLTPLAEHDATEALAIATILALTPQATYQPSDALAVAVALTLSPQVTHQATLALAVQTILALSSSGTQNATIALAIQTALNLTPQDTYQASVPLVIATALNLTPMAEHDAADALAIQTTLALTAQPTHPATIALAIATTLTAGGLVEHDQAIGLAVQVALALTSQHTAQAAVNLAVQVALALSPQGTLFGTTLLAVQVALSLNGTVHSAGRLLEMIQGPVVPGSVFYSAGPAASGGLLYLVGPALNPDIT